MADKVFNKALNVFNAFEFEIDYSKALELVNPHLENVKQPISIYFNQYN